MVCLLHAASCFAAHIVGMHSCAMRRYTRWAVGPAASCVAAACVAPAAAGIELIAEALAFNSSLLCLDLSDNKIGNAGALALAEALHSNKTLAELQLSNNRIGAYMASVLELW
jgi:hypothetical protein